MSKNILIVVLILVVAGLVYYFGFYQKPSGEPEEQSQLPNPAAVYCEEQEGSLEGLIFEAGSKTYCMFDDGSKCWQWDFYRGDCKKGDLKIEVTKEGEGKMADTGDTVSVHYKGMLINEAEFDSSHRRGEPFSFTLGEGRVIKGWGYGVLGMKVGEKRKLTIASDLAYGETGVPGTIPPGATLIFEVELVGIR